MSNMTYNTLAFCGSPNEIERMSEFLGNSLENCWGQTIQFTTSDHDLFSTLKMTVETQQDPPIEEIATMYRLFPTLKGVYRVTLECSWYETTIIRYDPERGFQQCLVDDPNRFNDDKDFVVEEGYIADLKQDKQLRAVSELVGINLDRIQARGNGSLGSI